MDIITYALCKGASAAAQDAKDSLKNYSLITETGNKIELSMDNDTFKITAILKDKNGNTISTSEPIDLPLESVVVNGRYDNSTKNVTLTLQNDTDITFSIGDLIDGLVNQTDYNNKISALETDISGKMDKIPVISSTETTAEIKPNKFYNFGEVASLNITFAEPKDNDIFNEYMFEFISGSTATVLTLPDSVKWIETGAITTNKRYQVSILNDMALIVGVDNA